MSDLGKFGLRLALLAALALGVAMPLQAATYFVDGGRPDDSGDGLSWAAAKKTIQAAIDAAPADSEVWVKAGTYNTSVTMKSAVGVYGGFAGTETAREERDPDTNVTVIDGSTARGGSPAYHVVTMDSVTTTTLNGFTVTGGNANSPTYYVDEYGGGIYAVNADASNTIADCRITTNAADSCGGGIYLESSLVAITSCTLSHDSAWEGGGVDLEFSSSAITSCTLSANSARYGGAISMYNGSPTITNCTLSNNNAYYHGAGILVYYGASLTLTNCTLSSNTCGESGVGGGVWLASSSNVTLRNDIFEGHNKYAIYEYATDSDTTATHCLFYNNSDGDYFDDGATSRTGANAINLYVAGASGNVSGDPLFVDKDGGDFHLQDGSAALDRGTTVGAPATDFEGDARPGTDGMVDIGADEAPSAYASPADATPPESFVWPLPLVRATTVFDIAYATSDAESGVQYVRLYYRKDGGDWTQYGGNYTSSPVSFDSSTTGGDGRYEFYSRATDNNNNTEDAPGAADAQTLVVTSFAGSVVYVKADAAGTGLGTDWANACLKIGEGLAIAGAYSVPEVRVAQGTYGEAITMPPNVALRGGYAGSGTTRDVDAYPTIIDGSTARGGQPAYHVVTMDTITTATVEGFTITGGNGGYGGGIYAINTDASNAIADCRITTNSAECKGGGICLSSSTLVIANCELNANKAGYGGGGISAFCSSSTIANCTLTSNSVCGWGANEGGGAIEMVLSSATVTNCMLVGNQAGYIREYPSGAGYGLGGGIYLLFSDATITSCTLTGNSAWGYYIGLGGGMNLMPGSTATITNCMLSSNHAKNGGGGMFLMGVSPQITNCTLNGNNVDHYGGAIVCASSSPTLTNCTLSGNTCGEYGVAGGIYLDSSFSSCNVTFRNDIFEGHNKYAIYEYDSDSDTTATHCLFYNNSDGDYFDDGATSRTGANAINLYVAGASGNVSGDPLFVDKDGGDFHLQDGSAALDRGTTVGAPATDSEGDARPGTDGLVDTGADEAPSAYAPPADATPPESFVWPLPLVRATTVFDIAYATSDAESGVQYVRLYYRKDGGDWTQYGGNYTSSPISFDSSTTGGDGRYEFYVRATDNNNITEDAPGAADAQTSVVTSFAGSVVYVKGDAAGSGMGTDWTNACLKIGDGLAIAEAHSVPEVRVAQGTYAEAITMQSNVALRGGYAGSGTTRDVDAYPTIIDGSTAHGGSPAYHVVTMDTITTATLEGFTITGGNANGTGTYADGYGGGIYAINTDASNTIADCRITTNVAVGAGGGVNLDYSSVAINNCILSNNESSGGGGICMQFSSPLITNCSLSGNSAYNGGGICMQFSSPLITNCTLNENVGGYGAGISILYCSSPTITGCMLSGNSVGYGGGGVFLSQYCSPTITSCTLSGNDAYIGGGVYMESYCSPVITNCTLSGNSAEDDGGGIEVYNNNFVFPTIMNCTLSGNSAESQGGGISLWINSSAVLRNVIFDGHNNYAIYEKDSACDTTMSMCLFHNNDDGDYYDEGTTGYTGAAAINANVAGASGNVDGDPRFMMDQNWATTGTWTAAPVYDPVLDQTTLTQATWSFVPGNLVGAFILADAVGSSRTQVLITGNTATRILVAGDVTGYAHNGDTWKLVDYHLASGSAAIDTGTSQTAPADDIEGSPRPVNVPGQGSEVAGNCYDIGAYEAQIAPLTVISAQGSPSPGVGTNYIVCGMPVTASVPSPVSGPTGTRYVCTGWSGQGSVAPPAGSSTSLTFFLDEASTLTWQWKTQYQLTAAASPTAWGSVTLADGVEPANGTWHDSGAAVTIRGIGASGYGLSTWSGAASGSNSTTVVTMSVPRSVTGNFLRLEIWVDFAYQGTTEAGTEAQPYKRLDTGLANVAPTGTIKIKHSSSTEHAQITKAVHLQAVGGLVRIGVP